MRVQHLRWCLLIVGLILLVSLVGCSASVTPTPSPSATPLSATFEALPSPPDTSLQDTSTPSPQPEIPTQTPLPPRPSKALTPTSVPTLADSEEQELVLNLLQDNGGCQLPCWWGFTPGETTWHTAQEFFASRQPRITTREERSTTPSAYKSHSKSARVVMLLNTISCVTIS